MSQKNAFEITASSRESLGTSACRRMRRLNNTIPAILYGADKQPEQIQINHDEIVVALENEAFYSHILTINVAGKAQEAVLKDVQRHPYKRKILHVDFMRIKANEKITMHVPIHFLNEESAHGVKIEGGKVNHLATEVEIACLPRNLPEFLEIDIVNMKLGETLHYSDIKLPEGVEIPALAHDNDSAIVSIQMPKAAAEEAPTAEATTGEAKPAGDQAAAENKSE